MKIKLKGKVKLGAGKEGKGWEWCKGTALVRVAQQGGLKVA